MNGEPHIQALPAEDGLGLGSRGFKGIEGSEGLGLWVVEATSKGSPVKLRKATEEGRSHQ